MVFCPSYLTDESGVYALYRRDKLYYVGFPVYLSGDALGDSNYYNFISDGFQELAKACGLYPCVLDAVIFSSYDDGGWTEENIVW